jgi:hypothetical protein
MILSRQYSFLPKFALALVAVVLAGKAAAQSLAELRFLGGVTFEEEGSGDPYAYLLWQSEDKALLLDRPFAVFTKPGPPGTGGSFTQRGVFQLQTYPLAIRNLINSMPAGFVDELQLESIIDTLFGSLTTDPSLTLEEKLSAVLQMAETDETIHARLMILARARPVLGVLMGIAAVVPMENSSSITTLECRAQAHGAQPIIPNLPFDNVVGRLTLNHLLPPPIPAPVAPVQIPDNEPTGHLNARLRWAIPENLARLSPITYGFDVFRVDRALAEGKGWVTNPPDVLQFVFAVANSEPGIVQVNELPVLPSATLSQVEAADVVGDPDTFFVLDNNDALDPELNGIPFAGGEQFYYFVAARDLLGRPGSLSQGTLVTICRTMPPLPPTRVRVENAYAYNAGTQTSTQELEVTWQPADTPDAPDLYAIYRWENVDEMLNSPTPNLYNDNRIATVAFVPGQSSYSYTDDGASAPSVPADLGKTFWYSVRSIKTNACWADLLSGNSSPAYGVLRDRVGPTSGISRTLTYSRWFPRLLLIDESTTGNFPPDLSVFPGPDGIAGPVAYFDYKITRRDTRIVEAHVYLTRDEISASGDAVLAYIGGGTFPAGNDTTVQARFRILEDDIGAESTGAVVIIARDTRGRTATLKRPFANYFGQLDTKSLNVINLDADLQQSLFFMNDDSSADTIRLHDALVPGSPGTLNPVTTSFILPATAREFKLYKRINGGPLLLVEQGTDESFPATIVSIQDTDLPAQASEICYFLQFFDEHGNPSPMAFLGCLETSSRVSLPQPIISDVQFSGDEETVDTEALLTWFSPRNGVERFQVLINDGTTRVSPGSMGYSDLLSPVSQSMTVEGVSGAQQLLGPSVFVDGIPYRAYQTPRIGPAFGDPADPELFSVPLNVAPGRPYNILIRAVSAAGNTGPLSKVESFSWSPAPEPTNIDVPWPARPQPTFDPLFLPSVRAHFLPDPPNREPEVGIRIGDLLTTATADPGEDIFEGTITTESANITRIPTYIQGPSSYILDFYTSTGNERIFPCVVYRYQETNSFFPTVSGDVVQVSPLIDRMRAQVEPTGNGGEQLAIYDPFIDLRVAAGDPSTNYGIYIRDTQGVIAGATYRYLIVRYRTDGEVDRVIRTNAVTVPLIP